VDPNPSTNSRSDNLLIGNQSIPVSQDGVACNYNVTPTSVRFTAGGGQGQLVVQTGATCTWTALSPVLWIGSFTVNGIPGSAGTGNGTLGYFVAPNPSPQARTANLTVAGQTIPVTQDGVGIVLKSVVNGASFLPGPLAPGELFTIFGTGLGPSQPVGFQLTPDGKYATTSLGGTRVLFDGMAAPLTYVSATQVNAIVPFSLAGASTTQLVVEVQGVASSPTTMQIVPVSPAIFPGAVLNQDNSANSATKPATAASVLQIFATGFGQTSPAGVDGQICGTNPSKPVQPVTATIGGVAATVQYAGTASGLVAGVMQVNVQVPAGVKAGNSVPVVLTVAGVSSPGGYMVAIR
jgi:uncharacterized protein (TIGR03437 family)